MAAISESDRTIILKQEADAGDGEYEASRACWVECEVYSAYHEAIDRELDRREDALLAADLPFSVADGEDFDPDELPFD